MKGVVLAFLRAALPPLILCLALVVFHFVAQIVFVRVAFAAGSRILFYNGLGALFVSLMAGAALVFWRPLRAFGAVPFLSCHVAAASVVLVYFVVFPVTFDRSVSTFLLQTIGQHPNPLHTAADARPIEGGVSVEDLSNAFVRDYVVKRRAIERRVFEQAASGNIEVTPEGRVTLTGRGQGVLAFGDAVMALYGTQEPLFEEGR